MAAGTNGRTRVGAETGRILHREGSYRPHRTLDIHEILKHDVFTAETPPCTDHFEKNRPCPSTVYGVSDQYMVLDSFEKVATSQLARGELEFNFMVQGVTRDQVIGVKDLLDTIISIRVGSFTIPLPPLDNFDPAEIVRLNPGFAQLGLTVNGPSPAPGAAAVSPRSQIPFNGRVTMYLKEIGLQSVSDADDRRHHFEFDAEPVGAPAPPTYPDGDRLRLTPLRGGTSFIFTDPIKDIHGLTVCFYNPGACIRLPPDTLNGVSATTDAAQQVQFTYVDSSNLVNLTPGDRIYVKGFATGTYPLLDSYIARPEGHLVGTAGFTMSGPTAAGTTVTFRLNPDISTATLVPPLPADTPIAPARHIVIRIAKNRIRIPLRFRRIVGRLTNYIAP
jgi:hypothetical protein